MAVHSVMELPFKSEDWCRKKCMDRKRRCGHFKVSHIWRWRSKSPVITTKTSRLNWRGGSTSIAAERETALLTSLASSHSHRLHPSDLAEKLQRATITFVCLSAEFPLLSYRSGPWTQVERKYSITVHINLICKFQTILRHFHENSAHTNINSLG